MRGFRGGKTKNRPGLNQALDAVCGSKGNVLVVYSLSRMARSTKDTIAISERLKKAHANLASVSEKIDTTSASGKMIFRLLSVLAEFEADVLGERVRMAAAYKRSKGEAWSNPAFGHKADENGMLVKDEAEQDAISIVLALRAAGRSIRAIVDEMNARAIPRRNGGRWHIASVQRLLAG